MPSLSSLNCSNSTFLVNQINTAALDPKEFVFIAGAGSDKDPWGEVDNGTAGSIYVKASLDKNVHFIDKDLTQPCFLINSPSTVELNQYSYAYETDPSRSVIANVAAEDMAITIGNQYGDVSNINLYFAEFKNNPNVLKYAAYVSPIYANTLDDPDATHGVKSDLFTPIAPKAAHPYFAAVPFKNNQAVYGPWCSYPRADGQRTDVAGSVVKVMDDFVPWNYGGMAALDSVARSEISSLIQYERSLEMGSVSVVGLPTYDLGGIFASGVPQYQSSEETITLNGLSYRCLGIEPSGTGTVTGPVITNLSVNINSSNVGTTYSFRTYTKKVGFFNKENQDTIRRNAQQFLQLQRDTALAGSTTNSKSLQNQQSYETSLMSKQQRSVKGAEANLYKSKFFASSPGWVLAGFATPFLDKNEAEEGNDGKGVEPVETYQDALKSYKMKTFVGLYPGNEVPANVAGRYPAISVMSLDGMFSPVSFYPGANSATYGMYPYPRKLCSFCSGTGSLGLSSIKNSVSGVAESVDMPCPYCYDKFPMSSKTSATNNITPGSNSELLPPYVISNNNDIDNLRGLLSGSASAESSSNVNNTKSGLKIPINLENLNPIVVPQGIFRNTNTGSDDREKTRHCIEIVANSKNFHGSKMGITSSLSVKDKKNPNFTDYSDKINAQLNNQRFIGLRGPLVLHGWGYDIDGYPVPNESDEPRYDNKGRPLRFKAKAEEDGGIKPYDKLSAGDAFVATTVAMNDVFTVGYSVKTPNDSEQETTYGGTDVKKIKVTNDLTTEVPGTSTTGYKNGGDIITKQYTWNGSKYIKGDRSTKFRINHSEQPNHWPVGPVDLRWDYNRRVWTIPANNPIIYKWVYVTLEEDLVRSTNDTTYAARAYIDDIEYVAETLESGYRRLVYVKDRGGYTAPRGTKLFCKYMQDTGFYEPINKPVVIVTGVINSSSQATLDHSFPNGNNSTSPTMVVSYNNPLGFDVSTANENGIFTFINGSWTLTSKLQTQPNATS